MTTSTENTENAEKTETPEKADQNRLYVLYNGGPSEWALLRKGNEAGGVYLVRFDGVPDELADAIADSGKPSHYWEQLVELEHSWLE